jgi:hypothetical protein
LEELEKLKDELTAVRTQVDAVRQRKDDKLDVEKVGEEIVISVK